MTIQLFVAPIVRTTPCRISPSIVVRVALTLAAFTLAIMPVLAAERPVLRGDVVATGDVLTLGDLVEGVSGPEASRPLFRAPALGETGTVQAARIVAAAAGIGLPRLETDGRGEILDRSDLSIERKPREALPPDIQTGPAGLGGQVARRALAAGQVIRAGDFARPDLVARGDTVTV